MLKIKLCRRNKPVIQIGVRTSLLIPIILWFEKMKQDQLKQVISHTFGLYISHNRNCFQLTRSRKPQHQQFFAPGVCNHEMGIVQKSCCRKSGNEKGEIVPMLRPMTIIYYNIFNLIRLFGRDKLQTSTLNMSLTCLLRAYKTNLVCE